MLYKDSIKTSEFLSLSGQRGICLSLFLPTTRLTQDAQADRIEFKNLAKDALDQAVTIADKRQIRAMEAMAADLEDDDDFWAFQAYGLCVLFTPQNIRTYRLPYSVEKAAEASDRFYLKPLLPSLRPKTAWLLAISQKSVNLYEFLPSQELIPVEVRDLPKDFSDATRRTLQRDKAPVRRLEGLEGHKVLQTQFLRAVEKAVHPYVADSRMSLILATTSELAAIYRSLNRSDELVDEMIEGSVENLPLEDLKQRAIPLVKGLYQRRIDRWVARYEQFKSANRAISDLASIARLASHGQVSDLLVDADQVHYGTMDESGGIVADTRGAGSYDLIDEIIVRVLQSGGDVLAVRKGEDAPAALMPISAILRWS